MNRKRIIIASTIAAVGVLGVFEYSFINSSSDSASSEPNHDDVVDAAAVSASATDAFLAPVETLAAETSEPVEAPAEGYGYDHGQGYAQGQGYGYGHQTGHHGGYGAHHGQGSHRGQGAHQGRHYENCPYYSATE